MMTETDVLVVGTGPAGGMAAWMAAREGASVLVVDRKSVIGEPVRCAEGTFSSLLSLFDLQHGRWIANEYSGAIIRHAGMKDIRITPKKLKGVSLDRPLFEQEICRRARDAGAEIMLGKTVTGMRDGGISLEDGTILSSKTVIGADGVESMIGRWAGILDPPNMGDIASAAQYILEDGHWEADMAELILGSDVAPNGYLWVFPKSRKRANVGAVTTPDSRRLAKDLLDNLISARFSDARIVGRSGGCVPVAPPLSTAIAGNVLLAGDSARFSSAFGAGGIHSALFSGALAGRTAARYAAGKISDMREYDTTWKKALYKNLARSYRLKTRTYSSDRGMKRSLRLFRVGGMLISHIPMDPMGFWWGRLDRYVQG